MALLKLSEPNANKSIILQMEKRKMAQYIGEGSIFLLLIAAGAAYIFSSVRSRLKQSQQQEDFMMAITHELKTPIAVASLNLETMQKRKLDEHKQQHLIQTTLEETKRLDALCNNLLLSSRIEAGGYVMENEELNFTNIVTQTTSQFKQRFADREFIQNTTEPIFANGDPFLLQMAVSNLIDNAVKYSPKNQAIEIILQQNKHTLFLYVKDNGCGIADADKEKIFTKYYRSLSAKAKGTGLGLYLVKKIASLHKGNISMTNNTPCGSIFTLQLPANG
jgi:signal transduction histidine kinase